MLEVTQVTKRRCPIVLMLIYWQDKVQIVLFKHFKINRSYFFIPYGTLFKRNLNLNFNLSIFDHSLKFVLIFLILSFVVEKLSWRNIVLKLFIYIIMIYISKRYHHIMQKTLLLCLDIINCIIVSFLLQLFFWLLFFKKIWNCRKKSPKISILFKHVLFLLGLNFMYVFFNFLLFLFKFFYLYLF